jgi:hypothetical protein
VIHSSPKAGSKPGADELNQPPKAFCLSSLLSRTKTIANIFKLILNNVNVFQDFFKTPDSCLPLKS